jgi:hypothetical protein
VLVSASVGIADSGFSFVWDASVGFVIVGGCSEGSTCSVIPATGFSSVFSSNSSFLWKVWLSLRLTARKDLGSLTLIMVSFGTHS